MFHTMRTADFGPKILVWYDRSLRLWTAIRQDRAGNQIGSAGYGTSKQEAIEDVEYQARIDSETKPARRRTLVGEVPSSKRTVTGSNGETEASE